MIFKVLPFLLFCYHCSFICGKIVRRSTINDDLETSKVFKTFCVESVNKTREYSMGTSQDRSSFQRLEITDNIDAVFIGVFDGMYGDFISDWLASVMGVALRVKLYERLLTPLLEISTSLKENLALIPQIVDVIKETVLYMDKMLCDQYENAYIEGSTASFVLILVDYAFIVNIGDSKTIMLENGQFKITSHRHLSNRPSEIKKANRETSKEQSAQPSKSYEYRMMVKLPYSRAFGHCRSKISRDFAVWKGIGPYNGVDGVLRAVPDVIPFHLHLNTTEYEFLSATSGIFNKLDASEIAYYIQMMQNNNF